jgi:hypothetical protein
VRSRDRRAFGSGQSLRPSREPRSAAHALRRSSGSRRVLLRRAPDAGGVSQSYGQLVRLGVIENFFGATPKTFNPGDTCRGGSNVPE